MKLKTLSIARHRNGVRGEPFHAVLFKERGKAGSIKLAVLFDQANHCAVLEVVKLAAGDIAFGSNSWRGDEYESQLRVAIEADDRNRSTATRRLP